MIYLSIHLLKDIWLLPSLGNYEQSCCKHSCADFLSGHEFITYLDISRNFNIYDSFIKTLCYKLYALIDKLLTKLTTFYKIYIYMYILANLPKKELEDLDCPIITKKLHQ